MNQFIKLPDSTIINVAHPEIMQPVVSAALSALY
jgi:hypothetical protein